MQNTAMPIYRTNFISIQFPSNTSPKPPTDGRHSPDKGHLIPPRWIGVDGWVDGWLVWV